MRVIAKKNFFKKNPLLWICIIILVGFIWLFTWFNKSISPKLTYIAEQNLTKYIDIVASDFQIFLDSSGKFEDFLEIKENEQGEISSVDYDMVEIYSLASELTTYLHESLKKAYQQKTIPYSNQTLDSRVTDGIVLDIPLGIISNSPFLVNLGPKIPVTIRFIDSVFSNVKTRLTNYGINNAMIEVYLNVTISYEVILPVTKETKEKSYELLIDSKLIQGKVPEWYNKSFESQSAFLELPFK